MVSTQFLVGLAKELMGLFLRPSISRYVSYNYHCWVVWSQISWQPNWWITMFCGYKVWLHIWSSVRYTFVTSHNLYVHLILSCTSTAHPWKVWGCGQMRAGYWSCWLASKFVQFISIYNWHCWLSALFFTEWGNCGIEKSSSEETWRWDP